MGEHSTWFQYIPGFSHLEQLLAPYLKRKSTNMVLGPTHFTLTHVAISVFVFLIMVYLVMRYSKRLKQVGVDRVLPDGQISIRSCLDGLCNASFGLVEDVMGTKKATKYFPLVATFIFFILFNNMIGLVPGFLSATDTLKTNIALSGAVFLLTHILGFKEHGASYIKQFTGPVPALAPLIAPIELIGHLVRPMSLALRLLGNMFADHKVLLTFFTLVPLLLPLPFYLLGILVCAVQTIVFSLLAVIYFDLALSHDH